MRSWLGVCWYAENCFATWAEYDSEESPLPAPPPETVPGAAVWGFAGREAEPETEDADAWVVALGEVVLLEGLVAAVEEA